MKNISKCPSCGDYCNLEYNSKQIKCKICGYRDIQVSLETVLTTTQRWVSDGIIQAIRREYYKKHWKDEIRYE